jgi:hypothetical protein
MVGQGEKAFRTVIYKELIELIQIATIIPWHLSLAFPQTQGTIFARKLLSLLDAGERTPTTRN